MNTNNEHTSKNSLQRKLIYSVTPFTLLDYPDKTACILWFAGCNMRCIYCYNPEIVCGKGKLSYNDIQCFLDSRKNLLDAVVLSGGECLLHDSVKYIVAAIKELGYLIKVDTNGSRTDILQNLIDRCLIDYVSLDFKSPSYKFSKITASEFYQQFIVSLNILKGSKIKFEVRTTIHSSLLSISDLQSMAETLSEIGYHGKYFLQHFRQYKETLGNPGNSLYEGKLKGISADNLEIILR